MIMNGDPISQRNFDNNTYLQGMNIRIPKYLFSSTHKGTILIKILDQTTDELSTNVEKIAHANMKKEKKHNQLQPTDNKLDIIVNSKGRLYITISFDKPLDVQIVEDNIMELNTFPFPSSRSDCAQDVKK